MKNGTEIGPDLKPETKFRDLKFETEFVPDLKYETEIGPLKSRLDQPETEVGPDMTPRLDQTKNLKPRLNRTTPKLSYALRTLV